MSPRRSARWIGAAVIAASSAMLLSSSCAPREPSRPESSRSARPHEPGGATAFGPARYLVPDSSEWVERTAEGLDRVVENGCRLELRGAVIARTGPAEPEVEAGFPAPPWASPLPGAAGFRYLFWKDKELYGASSFLGELTRIATASANVARAFDWVDGVGLLTGDGVLTVRSSTGSPEPFALPGVVAATSADGRRGVALTTFGRAWLTLDGGGTFRDVSAELGEATRVEVRGDEIVAFLGGERRRFVGPAGALTDSSSATGLQRGVRPPELDDKWPLGSSLDPIEAAALSGIALGEGGVMVAARGVVGRVDIASAKASASVELPDRDASCAPVRVQDALLLACESKERASILDVSGVPRVERTFELDGGADSDRFAAADGEALGFLGPCDGAPPKASDLDVVTADSPYNASPQRSPVFCARASRDVWIEHRLDPADQADVIGWAPRPGGEAVALIARPGTFLEGVPRVSVRGPLRVVRVARSEPPLAIPPYDSRSSTPLARALRALPDGSIEGWLPTINYPSNQVCVMIDPEGRVRLRPAPSRATSLSAAGPFAMAQTEDGELYETIDWGRRWLPVDPPPGSPMARLSGCSPAGCRIGPFVRLGWASADPALKTAPTDALALPDDTSSATAQRVLRERQYRRPPPAPPIVRLRCGFASAGEGTRVPESYGFGVTAAAVPRMSGVAKLSGLGVIHIPWSGSRTAVSGDAEVAWLPLFDTAAPVRRVTIPLSSVSLDLRYRPQDVRLGYVITADGRVDPIAVGPKESCVASLLERAGLTRPIGGCASDPTVGVDLGDRVILLHARYGTLAIEAAGSRGVIAQRELYQTPIALGSFGYSFAVGSRMGAPVALAIDGRGRAVLSPIDPARGTLGAEERVAPLTDLRLGSDPRCSAKPEQARVIFPFDTEIGLDRASLPGLSASGTYGLAVLRWSPSEVCLDALELSVRDERYELDLGLWEPPSTVRKIIATFAASSTKRPTQSPALPRGAGNGTLALVMNGTELRQRLQCSGIGP